jgi:hydroxymethylglutaryl-CoA lyase
LANTKPRSVYTINNLNTNKCFGTFRYDSIIKNVANDKIRIFEVGPRDGLQNEKLVSTEKKISLIQKLINLNISNIEITSFVSKSAIPQFADSDFVAEQINSYVNSNNLNDLRLSTLVPTSKYMEKAIKSNIKEIAIFTSVSDAFNMHNIKCNVDESFNRFEPIIEMAKPYNIKVRGYVSCIAGCPYAGEVSTQKIIEVTKRLLNMGVYEVSLGDTIGVGTPDQIKQILTELKDAGIDFDKLAVHFHNTNGMAIQNIAVALEFGIKTIDSSIGGLGGCPYAKLDKSNRAVGNVSTLEVLKFLELIDLKTEKEINLDEVMKVDKWVRDELLN